jgi:hypothetical protein
MRKLLNEISVIPGVAGSCIFDKKEGPLCKNMQADLSEDLVETIGIHLVRLLQMGTMSNFKVKSVHFRYDKYAVVGMPLDSGVVLMTICEAHANCSLVATTAAMLASDLKDDLTSGVTETIPLSAQIDADILETSAAEMQPLYSKLEEALAGAIGPIASMIMQDHLEQWKASGPELPTRISELVTMLVGEIGDPGLAQEFNQKIKDIC